MRREILENKIAEDMLNRKFRKQRRFPQKLVYSMFRDPEDPHTCKLPKKQPGLEELGDVHNLAQGVDQVFDFLTSYFEKM